MPRITFTGEPAQAPTGYAIWQPGEEREVTERQAQELAGNVHYVRADSPAPEARPIEADGPVVSRSPIVPPPPAPAAPPPPPIAAPAQGG